MTYELNFESEPFVTDPEFDEALGRYETELADWEWEDETNRYRRPYPAPRSALPRARPRGRIGIPGRRVRSVVRPTIRPPIRPRFRPIRPVLFPTIGWPPYPPAPSAAEPSGTGPAPGVEPSEPSVAGSEHVRWVQDSLNRILGLRLPVNGMIGSETRRAIRSFQQRQGLPITGLIGPDTERALIAATTAQSPGIGGTNPAESGMPADASAPASEFDFEWENFDDNNELDFSEFEFPAEIAQKKPLNFREKLNLHPQDHRTPSARQSELEQEAEDELLLDLQLEESLENEQRKARLTDPLPSGCIDVGGRCISVGCVAPYKCVRRLLGGCECRPGKLCPKVPDPASGKCLRVLRRDGNYLVCCPKYYGIGDPCCRVHPIPSRLKTASEFEFERPKARLEDAGERQRKALAKRLQDTPVGRALTKMGAKISIDKAPPLHPAHWVRGLSSFEVHCGRQRNINVVFGLFDQQKKKLAWYLFSSTVDSRSKIACKRSGSAPVVKSLGVASAVATFTPDLRKNQIDVSELVRDAKNPAATMTLNTKNDKNRITCRLDNLNTKSNGLVHLTFGLVKVSEPSRANIPVTGRLFFLDVEPFDEGKFTEPDVSDPRRILGPQAIAMKKALSNF